MPKSNLKHHLKSNLNTNGRTDGLTKKALTTQQKVPSRTAREKHEIPPCVCLEQRDSCPDNCFLRWF